MRNPFQPAAFRGRFFFVSAVFVCSVRTHAAGIASLAVAPLFPATLGSVGALPAGSIRTQLEQANLWPLQAVVLDMDGVAAPNSGALWTGHGQEFLRRVAPGWAEGDLRNIKWKRLPDVHRWITDNRGARLSYEDYARRREALAARIYGELAELEPTLFETRDALKRAGVPVALASANTRFSVDSMIRRFDLERVFDVTASSDELSSDEAREGKSRTHLLASRRLGVPPNRSLAVEDTPEGVRAAREAGMAVAGFRNGFNDRADLSDAHFEIRELRQLLDLFRRPAGEAR